MRQLGGDAGFNGLDTLRSDLQLQEQIIAELSEEAYAWHLDAELWAEEAADIAAAEASDAAGDLLAPAFFCPCCQRSLLRRIFDHWSCERCCQRFKPQSTIGQQCGLQEALQRVLADHERGAREPCATALGWFGEPLAADATFAALTAVCADCDFVAQL